MIACASDGLAIDVEAGPWRSHALCQHSENVGIGPFEHNS